MSTSHSDGPLASSGRLARNTAWNLAGMLLPALAAIAAIPLLIDRLGDARFGVLALAWGLALLFALSDFGLARATTTLLSKGWGRSDAAEQAGLFWASMAFHLVLGLLAGGAFAAATPWMVTRFLDVPIALQPEAARAFYLMALSIPFVLVGNPLRAVLESTQRFGALNAVRLPSSLLNYVGPLALVTVTVRLEAIIGVIVATRILGLFAFAALAFSAAPSLRHVVRPSRSVVRALAGTGGWLGATGLALPAIASLDRLVIGAQVSIADVGYYAAPYEVVTKLWFLSGALLMVLYPVFSALDDADRLRRSYRRTVRLLFVPAVAAAAVIVAFATEIFTLWLGPEFGHEAASVARWLAFGTAVSVCGQVPVTLLQCRGRPDVPAVVHLMELPLYAALAWWLAGWMGTTGVAIAWSIRAVTEAAVLFAAVHQALPWSRTGDIGAPLTACGLGAALFGVAVWCGLRPDVAVVWRGGAMLVSLVAFAAWAWFRFYDVADRQLFSRAALTS